MRWRAGCASTIHAPSSRADAMGALAAGVDRLACNCGEQNCPAAEHTPPSVAVVHVIAEEPSSADDTPVQLDGTAPIPAPVKPLREMTLAEALAPPQQPPTGPARTAPAAVLGGGIVPAPMLAAKLADTATIRPLIHPGDRATPRRGRWPISCAAAT